MFLFCLVFAMFCARLFICALWSPAGKGLTSWLSFVVSSVSLSLSHWYPGSGVVLDCIDSWSLHHYLLWSRFLLKHSDVVFILLINVKMSTIVGILTFMSMINSMLLWVEHEKKNTLPESTQFSAQDIWFSMVRVCIGIFFHNIVKTYWTQT